MSFSRSRVPWTIWVVAVLAATVVGSALLIAPLIWADFIGDDGSPLTAVFVVAVSAVPLGLIVVMARRSQVAWAALLVIGGVAAVVLAPSPGLFVPLLADVLLLAPPTRRYVAG